MLAVHLRFRCETVAKLNLQYKKHVERDPGVDAGEIEGKLNSYPDTFENIMLSPCNTRHRWSRHVQRRRNGWL